MRRPFLLALLLLANIASARELVRLTAPSRAVLDGGGRAEVAWDAAKLPGDVDEWEAFLSVDGGRHYTTRITPHVGVGVRRVAFTVPNVASTDARILLRLGDEEHERIVELPQSFVIVPDYSKIDVPSVALTEREGESALFDEDHVNEWVSDDFVTHRHRDQQNLDSVATTRDEPSVPFASASAKARANRPRTATLESTPRYEQHAHQSVPPTRDTLLITTRLNV